jgi:hypothetical protein
MQDYEPQLQPGDRNTVMAVAEWWRGDGVRDVIERYGREIDAAATEFGVDAGLIRGIIYEEQTHLYTGIESRFAESLGIGETVGLGQITEGLHGFTREQLLDPTTNIRAIATHLSSFGQPRLIDPYAPISSLATRYNCGSCTSISSYGRRVNSYRAEYFLVPRSRP